MEKITAIIPTFNEEQRVEKAIQSVVWADEIMVVDSFSTDKTLEIAGKYTDFILQRTYENSASQKNWAIPQATHEWILLLDADEWVTPELEAEIRETLAEEPDSVAYWIYRENHFLGKRIKYSGWQHDKVIRLFRKSRCRYECKNVHAEVVADGQAGFLKHRIGHDTFKDLNHFLDKVNRYSWWSAMDCDAKTGRLTPFHFVARPMFRFGKHYVIQLGFLDGTRGFFIASLSAYSVLLRYVKLWILRMERAGKLNGNHWAMLQ